MCVIIHKPKNKTISKKVLLSAWESNSDGAGISVNINNTIQVIKGLMTFKAFFEVYQELKDLELIIHFRYATHGAKIPEFTHPFKIQATHCPEPIFTTDKVLHHNGVLNEFGSKDLSDTVDYINKILSKIPCDNVKARMLSKESSKFVIHSTNQIIKIGKFDEHKGSYFSNLYWLHDYKIFRVSKPYENLTYTGWYKKDRVSELLDDYLGEYFDSGIGFNSLSEFLTVKKKIWLTKTESKELDKLADIELCYELPTNYLD